MRKFMAGVIVGAVLGGAYATLDAQRPAGKYSVYGQGMLSCGKWVQAMRDDVRDDGTKFPLLGWMNGFVSGVGWTGANLKQTELDGMQLFVTNYCNANPLNTVAEGTQALVRALRQ